MIENSLKIPRYIQIKEAIKDNINNNNLLPHDVLPSVAQLKAEFGVSNITIAKALDELEVEGVIYRIHGKGTFVAPIEENIITIGVIIPHLVFLDDLLNNSDTLNVSIDLLDYVLKFGTTNGIPGFDHVTIIYHKLEEIAYKENINIIVCNNNFSNLRERKNIEKLIKAGVDGIIIFPSEIESLLNNIYLIEENNIPLIVIDNVLDTKKTNYVITNSVLGISDAVNKLYEKGYRKFLHVNILADVVPVKERLESFKNVVKKLKVKSKVVTGGFYGQKINEFREDSFDDIKKALIELDDDIAIVASNIQVLYNVIKAVDDLGFGNKNIAYASFEHAGIITPKDKYTVSIIQDYQKIAEAAINTILKKINGEKTEKVTYIDPILKERL